MAAGVGAALLTSRFSISSADDQQRLRVGMIIPEQGPFAGEAKSLLSGFYLFLKEKGPDAANVEILKRDPGPEDAKAVDAIADLVMNKRVHVLIGPPSVGGSEKVIHGVEGANVILNSSWDFMKVSVFTPVQFFPRSVRVRGNAVRESGPTTGWGSSGVAVR
jgi:hypothetical protein